MNGLTKTDYKLILDTLKKRMAKEISGTNAANRLPLLIEKVEKLC